MKLELGIWTWEKNSVPSLNHIPSLGTSHIEERLEPRIDHAKARTGLIVLQHEPERMCLPERLARNALPVSVCVGQ